MVHIKVSKVTKRLEIPYVNLSQNRRRKLIKELIVGLLSFSSSRTLSCDRSVATSKASSSESACYLVLPVPTYNIFSFPWGYPVAAYVLFFLFPSLLSPVTYFRRQFLSKTQPIQLVFLCFIVCWVFLSLLTLRFFLFGATAPPPVGQGLLIYEVYRSHSTTHHSR